MSILAKRARLKRLQLRHSGTIQVSASYESLTPILAKKVVTESVLPVGLPPLKDLAKFVVENKVPVYT